MDGLTISIGVRLGWRWHVGARVARWTARLRLVRVTERVVNWGLRGVRWRIGDGRWSEFHPSLRATL